MRTRKIRYGGAAFAALLSLPLAAAATSSSDSQRQSTLREQIVDADQILRGDIGNRLNTIGTVVNLVLSPDHTKVQYVLFDSVYPMTLYGLRNEYVSFSDVHVRLDRGDLSSHIVVDAPESARSPQELELTPGQAADRLVAGIIGKPLFFADGNSRRITDMLIDRTTGKVMGYVVDRDPASGLHAEPRAVPADKVTIQEDRVSTTVRLPDLEDLQKLVPALL